MARWRIITRHQRTHADVFCWSQRTISGVATQTVSYAGSGSAVMAIPVNGYYFVNWSDGVTANRAPTRT